MAKVSEIKAAVEDFVRSESSAMDADRMFAPWTLYTQHQVNVLDALAQTATAGGDDPQAENERFLDGFAVFPGTAFRPPELLVLRAVFSANEADLVAGLADLGAALCVAGGLALHGVEPTVSGPRMARLRTILGAMTAADRGRLQVRGELAHLATTDEETLQHSPAIKRAINDFQVVLARAGITPVQWEFRPPQKFRIASAPATPRPSVARVLSFSGTHWGTETEKVFIGRGRLADLVELYDHYREALFARNVRTYLHHEAKKPRSAARHIRAALDRICAGGPNLYFSMAHNGITLSAPHVAEAGETSVRVEPLGLGMHVLNGCQTVYTAWTFWREKAEAEPAPTASWRKAWNEIWLPLRIVVTTDEDRIRDVTVAANRQTEMRPSAFWAHDAAQLTLDRRFGRKGIYYERQQGAWDNLVASESPRVSTYPNGTLNIEELARTIAAASPDVAIDHAKGPAGIFDSEVVYRKVFAAHKLRSTRLLTALYNLQQATRLALLDLVDSVGYLNGLPNRSFQFPTMRLLAAWLAENDPEWLLAQGDSVYRNATLKDLRAATLKVLGPTRSKIQGALRDGWGTTEGWTDAYHAKMLRDVARTMGLKMDPFGITVPDEG